jgi:hypothetical protein
MILKQLNSAVSFSIPTIPLPACLIQAAVHPSPPRRQQPIMKQDVLQSPASPENVSELDDAQTAEGPARQKAASVLQRAYRRHRERQLALSGKRSKSPTASCAKIAQTGDDADPLICIDMSVDNLEKTAAAILDGDEHEGVVVLLGPLDASGTKEQSPVGMAKGSPDAFAVTVSSGHFAKNSVQKIAELCGTRLNPEAAAEHKREDMTARAIQRAFKKWRNAKRRRDSSTVV